MTLGSCKMKIKALYSSQNVVRVNALNILRCFKWMGIKWVM